jgi:hypothetical protein
MFATIRYWLSFSQVSNKKNGFLRNAKKYLTMEQKISQQLPQDIEDLHRKACNNNKTSYIDPHTGHTVFTELFHLKRGKCCGNKCRHCPFHHMNVSKSSEDKANK